MAPEKLIINAALTGIVPTREQNPHLPVTPEEIARDAERVHALGAAIVHIHARDESGLPTASKEVYREIIGRIRERCPELVITVSTSGRRAKDPAERLQVLDLEGDYAPDMASLILGSLNIGRDYVLNPPDAIVATLGLMRERGVRPELEIFECGMASLAGHLTRKGHLATPAYANLILGCPGTMAATTRHVLNLIDDLPPGVTWAATGVGRTAFEVQCLALAAGGHVRVGLEDSLFMDRAKSEPASNEKLVGRVVRVAEAMGRELAPPKEVRQLLGLPPRA